MTRTYRYKDFFFINAILAVLEQSQCIYDRETLTTLLVQEDKMMYDKLVSAFQYDEQRFNCIHGVGSWASTMTGCVSDNQAQLALDLARTGIDCTGIGQNNLLYQ